MDKKKLIGTIIGVLMFGLLVVGATFAWLQISPAFLNNTVNGKTTNFIVNYVKGTNITKLLILDSTTVSTSSFSAGTGGKISIVAYRATTSADGDLTIKLNTTTSNAIVSNGELLKYAVCSGACTLTETAVSTPTASSTGLLAKGTVNSTTQTLVTIDGISTTTNNTYDIYLWLDQTIFYTNSGTYNGLTYSGNISADAIQD